MAQSANESFVFYANKQTDIYFPIRNSQRVKYTSFHVCQSYIAFGSSSGGLYLFQKCQNNTYSYLFTILNSDNSGPITCLSFASNDDHIIAMATNRGNLVVVEIEPKKQMLYKSSWNIIYQSNNFTNSSINILRWDQYYRLYISDESGQIFILHNVKDMTNLMVVPLPSILLKISAKIFQLEVCGDLMLLSTQYKYILYDMCDSSLTQIGKKPRSDGQYGVCFFPKYITDNTIYNCIFASRPKSRLWEVDLKGNVRFTHQFKELLINQNSVQIINGQEICFSKNEKCLTTPTFAKLCVMNTIDLDTYIVTYSNTPNTCIYVINPIKARIVSYCVLKATLIHDMYCIENDIYLIYNISSDKRLRLSKISLLSLEQCLTVLTQNNEFTEAASFVINHMSYITEKLKSKNQFITNKMLENIWFNLEENDRQTFIEIESLIDRHNEKIAETQAYSESELSINTDNSSDTSNISNESDVYNRMNGFNSELYYEMDPQFIESGIDVVDIGFIELKRLKNIVLSKLNSVELKSNSEPLPSDNEELSNNSSITCLENNRINLDINKSQDLIEPEVKYDPKSVLQCLESELNISHYVDKCKCVCGSPLPGSHLSQSEFQEKIKQLIVKNMDSLEYSVIDLIDISYRNSIWPLFMDLLIKCEEYNKYIKHSLMLNDIKLLNKEKVQKYLLSKENFEQLLTQFAEQRDCGSDQIVRCLQCNKPLTDIMNSIKWETIIKFCIKSIGVEEAMILLKKFIRKNPVFSTQFYSLILRLRMISVYQSPVTREKLNKLMLHLNNIRDKSEIDNSSLLSSTSSSNITHNQNKYNGFQINLSVEKCSKCNISLIIKSKSEKIVAFYCKHIYHKSCISQNYCYLCKTL